MGRRDTAEDHDAVSLRRVARRVRTLCATVDEIADTMAEEKIARVTVRHQEAVNRALRDLSLWTHAAEMALTRALQDAGAFRAANDGQE